MTKGTASPGQRLGGRTFVVPRTSAGDTPISAMLAAEGATVVEFPSVAIGPPPDPGAVDGAIGRIETFPWVVFTHVSAARVFLDRLTTLRGDVRPLARASRLAAVGGERRSAVEAYGL
ncbi:MAG: uroporphyrinogen-III synthase, partial [Nitrospinota bacterium]